jgi:hypothetical protein
VSSFDDSFKKALAASKKGPADRLPTWNDKRGWAGGDSHRLYAFVDKLTGDVVVRPGGRDIGGSGPNATVRLATRVEGEARWQKPLHPGWKVEETPGDEGKDYTLRLYTREGGDPFKPGFLIDVSDERRLAFKTPMHVTASSRSIHSVIDSIFRSPHGRRVHSIALWYGKVDKKHTDDLPPRATYPNPDAA